jgi:hypothetical protein|nr:MAG TPA: Receptor Binding Protein [Caudoviricetes sp.]
MIALPLQSHFDSDPNGDRAVSDSDIREVFKSVWSNGVTTVRADGSDMQVQAIGGMKVKVMPGGCVIEGALGRNTREETINVAQAHPSLKRIDRIVVRLDLSDSVRNMLIYKKEGTPSTTPIAPNLVQQPNYYELALADIYVGAGVTDITSAVILDQRPDRELCGFVLPAFPTNFSLEAITDRWQSILEGAISGTAAGSLQNAIEKLKSDIQDANVGMTDVHINNASLESELVAYFGSSIRV